MAQVTLEIAGRSYQLVCRDGEEAHLLNLGQLVDRKARDAARAAGNMTENRQLLVTALLLADALNDQEASNSIPAPLPVEEPDTAWVADAIERIASRVEKLVAALEDGAEND